MLTSLPSRLIGLIEPEPNSGCWLWLGADRHGYGAITVTRGGLKRQYRSHRYVYELLLGAIPDETLDHRCKVTICCNPAHLRPMSMAENRDRPRLSHCRRGHKLEGHNVIERARTERSSTRPRRSCRECLRVAWRNYKRRRNANGSAH